MSFLFFYFAGLFCLNSMEALLETVELSDKQADKDLDKPEEPSKDKEIMISLMTTAAASALLVPLIHCLGGLCCKRKTSDEEVFTAEPLASVSSGEGSSSTIRTDADYS